MPETSPSDGAPKPVSMEDLKALEVTFKSSMDTQMREFQNMFLELKQGLIASSPLRTEESGPSLEEAAAKAAAASPEVPGVDGDPNKESYNDTRWKSPDPPIPHPHINNIGDPPKINVNDFDRWQFEFRSYMRRSCNDLWRIVERGFHPQHDIDNYTRREVVEAQLNSVALHMIQQAVGSNDLPFIIKYTMAKEAWEGLAEIYVGNESMKRNKESALRNQAEGFMKQPNEDHMGMYKRLLSIATAFRNVGATHINDKWIKDKYVEALMPYEAQDLKTLKGRHNFYEMTSHEVMQEMQAFKVEEKNAKDA